MNVAACGRAVGAAAERLAGRVVHTPLVESPWLSAAVGGEVRLKLENVQNTGSFKVRGATNALLTAPRERLARGVVAASSGNHGLGVAAAARGLGVPATVWVPSSTPPAKRDAIRAAGAEVEEHGDDCVETELFARGVAGESGRAYLSPYNDADVVAGQGTVAVELLADWPECERVYVAVGGGGLIGGMAAWARHAGHAADFVGCSPQASPAMAECVRAGAIVPVPCDETLSDSTAGGVEPGAITFPLCRDLVRVWIEVAEGDIGRALVDAVARQHLLVEGAAAVAIAACLADAAAAGTRSAVVICGGNLPLPILKRLLAES